MLVVGICVLLGAWLRLWNLDGRPLWVDEGFSLLYATIDWSDVVELRRSGTNPPLYHFLLSMWVGLFGPSATAMRSMSVAFSIGSLGLVYLLARRVADRAVAVVAVVLLACSNLAIGFAQEARFYALTQFLSLVASLLLCRLIDRPGVRAAAWYALSLCVLVWVHTYGWFLWAAHVVWLIAARREIPPDEGRRRRLTLLAGAAFLLAVISFLPWVPILAGQVRGVLREYWIGEPAWQDLWWCVHDMLVPDYWLRWPVIAAAGVAVLVGVRRWVRRRGTAGAVACAPASDRTPSWTRPCHVWGLIACLTLPILIPFVWSKLATPIFQVKYAILAQTSLLILFAFVAVRRPVVALLVLALVIWARPPSADRSLVVEDFRGAAQVLSAESTESATVFVYPGYAEFALAYYVDRRRTITPVWSPGQTSDEFAPYYESPPVSFDGMMQHLADPTEQEVWFVFRWGSAEARRERLGWVTQHRQVQAIWELRCVDVLQLRRSSN